MSIDWFDPEHDWFAWHPVHLIDGWVWLQTVRRRKHCTGFQSTTDDFYTYSRKTSK